MLNHALRVALLVLLGTASAGCLHWPRETDVRTPPAAPLPVRPPAAPDSPPAGVAMDQETFLRQAVIEERLDADFEIANEGHVLLGSPHVRRDADGRYVLLTLLSAKVLQDAQAKAARISND